MKTLWKILSEEKYSDIFLNLQQCTFKVTLVIMSNNKWKLIKEPCQAFEVQQQLILGIKFSQKNRKIITNQVSTILLNNRSNTQNESVEKKQYLGT